jgi:lactoylglutathione lyase
MKFKAPMLVVENIADSKRFYQDVLGLRVISDFGGENITFTGGLSIQSKASWLEISHHCINKVSYGGNDLELYFEEDSFDKYVDSLENHRLDFIHPVTEAPWGQRSVRFYDLDRHIIEVAEPLNVVCQRLRDEGLSVAEIAEKTYLPVKMIQNYLK